MTKKLPFTATAARMARLGWFLALTPPAAAVLYALRSGEALDWYRFFLISAIAVPTLLAVVTVGVLAEISRTLAIRPVRPASRSATPPPPRLRAVE